MAQSSRCRSCGAALPSDSLSELCGVCLLRGLQDGTAPALGLEGPTRTDILAPIVSLGERIGRYKLLQQIGEGGCGIVYLAEQEEPIRRRVALKLVKPGMDTVQVLARFEAERQALALMDHPHIAKVFDAGASGAGRPFFVMELVKGIPITRYCDENKLDTRQRLQLFGQVCQAIQHAHQKGIIHRDIKPSNILVTDDEEAPAPKVIDFGIAKATAGQLLTDKTVLTAVEQFIGTPAYMSPEQACLSGLDVDTRSDIYSLGVLLYELLTGRTPFDAKRLLQSGLDEIRRIIREEEPPRPSTRLNTLDRAELTTVAERRRSEPPQLVLLLKGDLDWIVMKTLEKDRNRRYETANDLAMDIRRYLNDEPILARPPSNLYRFQKLVRRNKLAFALTVGAVTALLTGLGVSLALYHRALIAETKQRQARQHAEAAATRAALETDRAKVAEAATRQQVLRLSVANGVRLQEEGNVNDALLWFARSLGLVEGDPVQEKTHRLRFASVLHQCPRLVQIFEHGLFVDYAEFSPVGRYVLTASSDESARVWDCFNGEPVTPALRHTNRVYHASFSPDGRSIVTASFDNTAQVWNAFTGEKIGPALHHSNYVVHAVFSPDGRRVLTASKDGTAQLWDARTGERVLPPFTHKRFLFRAVFDPEGGRVVTASDDQTAQIWNANTGQAIGPPLQHKGSVFSAVFSRDGQQVVTASKDGTAQRWNALTGERLGKPMKHNGAVLIAWFSPDGRTILTGLDDSTAHLWDVSTAEERITTPLENDGDVTWRWKLFPSFSPDGNLMLTVDKSGWARVRSPATAEPVMFPLQNMAKVLHAGFSHDSAYLVTASQDYTARVWDLRAVQNPVQELPRSSLIVNRVGRDHSGRRLLIPGAGHTLQIVDATTGQATAQPLQHNAPVRYAAFSPDDRLVVTVASDRTARVWNAATGSPLSPLLEIWRPVYFACFSPDSQILVTSSGLGKYKASLWQAATGQPSNRDFEHGGPIERASFSPDGQRLVTASADWTARVWDVRSGEAVTPALKHARNVTDAAFSPDGRLVVTSSYDRTARVWDAATGEPVSAPLKHSHPVLQAAFSSNSRVITACEDGLRAWDLPVDERPVADLMLLSSVLAGRQIQVSGVVLPLQPRTIRSGWRQLQNKYPANAIWNNNRGFAPVELQPQEKAALQSSLEQFELGQRQAGSGHSAQQFPIDLSNFYNAALTNDWERGNGGDGFSMAAEPGRLKDGGVGFDLRGVVQVSCEKFRKGFGQLEFPNEVRDIPVHRRCRLIHFLHGGISVDENEQLGSYTLRFKGGLRWQIPILGAYDVRSSYGQIAPEDARNSVVAWRGRWGNGVLPARLYRTTWEIPWPDLDLESIDFAGNLTWGAPFLVAITVE